jgi:lysophospholipase L1-like esterase
VQRLEVSLRGTVTVCIVQAGVNDVWRGVPRRLIERNFEEMIRYVNGEKRAVLVVTAVVLVDAKRAALNAEIGLLNASLSQLCERSAVHWLDLNETLAPAGYLEPRFTDDGTHFTGEGYRAIADPLRRVLSGKYALLSRQAGE